MITKSLILYKVFIVAVGVLIALKGCWSSESGSFFSIPFFLNTMFIHKSHSPSVYVFIMKTSTGQLRAIRSQLQIENVMSSHGGVYSCKATNKAGSSTQDFALISKHKTRINHFDFSNAIVILL